MINFGCRFYWDDKYKNPNLAMFDWLEDFNSLKGELEKHLKPEHKILITGCGNAKFSEDLYDAGYHNLYNIDISPVVIEKMRERNKERTEMVYEVMDVCDLKYPDNHFDIIIDKSTIDALLCGDNAYLKAAMLLKESQRVLTEDNGVYIAISFGKPETRSYHLERPFLSWKLQV